MIFKYFTYNKQSKGWDDTKQYYSICATVQNPPSFEQLYKFANRNKIFSYPIDYFQIGDFSEIAKLAYHICYLGPQKTLTIGRVEQLPDKYREPKAKKFGFEALNIGARLIYADGGRYRPEGQGRQANMNQILEEGRQQLEAHNNYVAAGPPVPHNNVVEPIADIAHRAIFRARELADEMREPFWQDAAPANENYDFAPLDYGDGF